MIEILFLVKFKDGEFGAVVIIFFNNYPFAVNGLADLFLDAAHLLGYLGLDLERLRNTLGFSCLERGFALLIGQILCLTLHEASDTAAANIKRAAINFFIEILPFLTIHIKIVTHLR